ncbi:E3 ubiquitin-protein ligase hrd1, partial [Nowakowskiella sp. JEL0078]
MEWYVVQRLQREEISRGGDGQDVRGIGEGGWDDKSTWLVYLELLGDFLKLVIYAFFFSIVVHFYGLPFHIVRDLYMTLRSFVIRVRDLIQYRRAIANMRERYPDATREELANGDAVCIICREDMSINDPVVDENDVNIDAAQPRPSIRNISLDTPKKLPCGHMFHFRCLRSWLERQQTCPTCRRSVLEQPGARNQNAAVPQAAGVQWINAMLNPLGIQIPDVVRNRFLGLGNNANNQAANQPIPNNIVNNQENAHPGIQRENTGNLLNRNLNDEELTLTPLVPIT